MTVKILTGHVLDRLNDLPDESIHMVLTSPPYMGLRSYQTEPQVWGGDGSCGNGEHEWTPCVGQKQMTGDTGAASKKQLTNRGTQFGNDALKMKSASFPGKVRASVAVDQGGELSAGRDVQHDASGSLFAVDGGLHVEATEQARKVGGKQTAAGGERCAPGAVNGAVPIEQPANEVPDEGVGNLWQSNGQTLARQDAVSTKDATERLAPDVPTVSDVADLGPLFGDGRFGGDEVADELGATGVHADKADRAVLPHVAVREHQAEEVGEIGAPGIESLPQDRVPGLRANEIGGVRRSGAGDGAEGASPLPPVPSGTEEGLTALLADDPDAGVLASHRTPPTDADLRGLDVKGLAAGVADDGRHASMICEKCGAIKCELGQEPTVSLFVDHLVAVFAAVKRVLRRDGVLFVNLGDSYNAYNGNRGKTKGFQGAEEARPDLPTGHGLTDPNLKPKDLMLVPDRFRIAMQEDGWYVRSKMPWVKRSAMPESVTDRPVTAVEDVMLFTKAKTYFWDSEAVKRTSAPPTGGRQRAALNGDDRYVGREFKNPEGGKNNKFYEYQPPTRNFRTSDLFFDSLGLILDEAGDPLALDVNPAGFKEAHFATFPPKLVRPLILAGTSERGCCPSCLAPYVRVVERFDTGAKQKTGSNWDTAPGAHGNQHRNGRETQPANQAVMGSRTTGWAPSCSCDAGDPVPCRVLDIFSGSGTTLLVADQLGRDAIGIDLNDSYALMSHRRVSSDAPLFADVQMAIETKTAPLESERLLATPLSRDTTDTASQDSQASDLVSSDKA